MKVKKQPSFWTSYSDLMSNLFFIMLVLFVLVLALLSSQVKSAEEEKNIAEERLMILEEIENSTDNIDSIYFEYNPEFKKHIVTIKVNFNTGDFNIENIGEATLLKLEDAGESIRDFIFQNTLEYEKFNIQYLLIIEIGRAHV